MAKLSWMKKAGRRAKAQAGSQKIVEEAAKKCTHPLHTLCLCKLNAAKAVVDAITGSAR